MAPPVDLGRLDTLARRGRLTLLAAMADTPKPFSTRDVERVMDATPSQARRARKELESLGLIIVKTSRRGAAKAYNMTLSDQGWEVAQSILWMEWWMHPNRRGKRGRSRSRASRE